MFIIVGVVIIFTLKVLKLAIKAKIVTFLFCSMVKILYFYAVIQKRNYKTSNLNLKLTSCKKLHKIPVNLFS